MAENVPPWLAAWILANTPLCPVEMDPATIAALLAEARKTSGQAVR